MPIWGDKNHDWDAIYDCVDIMYDMLNPISAKEKYGYLRCWAPNDTPEDYRAAYKKCLDKYPHMAQYILKDADRYELLVGLVPQDECKHPCHWESDAVRRCGVCMMEEEMNKEDL